MIALRAVARHASPLMDECSLEMNYLPTLATVFVVSICLMSTFVSSVQVNLESDDHVRLLQSSGRAVLDEGRRGGGEEEGRGEGHDEEDQVNESVTQLTSPFQVKPSQQTSPAPSSDLPDESTDNFTFPLIMLCTGLVSLAIASIILMMTAKKKRSYIRLREFPASLIQFMIELSVIYESMMTTRSRLQLKRSIFNLQPVGLCQRLHLTRKLSHL